MRSLASTRVGTEFGSTLKERSLSQSTPERATPPCRLYLVTPARIVPRAFATDLEAALDGGDVACLQLRLKNLPDAEVIETARLFAPICRRRDVALIVNDRPDLALAAEADGVHVGQTDASFADARRILGPDRIVGVTCHSSRDLAIEAADAGADYVAFGAFFPTSTKESTHRPEPEILRWWSEIMTVPSVAIGGIKVENCAALVEAGADFLAVVSGVWDYAAGPRQAVADFNAAIAKAAKSATS
jgi:thiamine-phosphate pyrophosphorylase